MKKFSICENTSDQKLITKSSHGMPIIISDAISGLFRNARSIDVFSPRNLMPYE
jgi:hypothetical protein